MRASSDSDMESFRAIRRSSIVATCCLLFTISPAIGQTGEIVGEVRDEQSREPIGGASVVLEGTRWGAATGLDGAFRITEVRPGTYRLRISMLGYVRSDREITVLDGERTSVEIELHPAHIETGGVVVTGTRTVRSIADVPVRVEAIPQEEIEEKLLMTPSNVAMLLNESTGMRVQTTSSISNAANLRIQGMSGRYTQLLTDGVPNFGGLSAGFSLTHIPPLNLRQVEVVKGATSALYGPDAIAGVVNFITKNPTKVHELSALINATTQGGFDAGAFYSTQSNSIGSTILLTTSSQPMYDVDADGFADIAQYQRSTVTPKVLYTMSDRMHANLTLGYTTEKRVGGMKLLPPDTVWPGPVFGLPQSSDFENLMRDHIDTKRCDGAMQFSWDLSDRQALNFNVALAVLERDAMYRSRDFRATQNLAHADVQYTQEIDVHTLLLGASLSLDDLFDRTSGNPYSRSYRYTSPGLLAQLESPFGDMWSVVASARVDFHNVFGTFVTPRASVMYRPTNSFTLRLGGGTGFKAPTIFVEEAEETGLANARSLTNIKAERVLSGSFDVNWQILLGDVGLSANGALFLASLQDALIVDADSLANEVLSFRNATGRTTNRGGELSLRLSYHDVKLSLGYTYLFADRSDRGHVEELDLNPRHMLGVVAVWEDHERGFKVGFENYWTGRQRLERNPFRTVSPDYWITGVIAEKAFGMVRLFVNFENVFDTRQTRFDPLIVRHPGEYTYRPLPVYAPIEGRVVNGGVRIVL
jgi:outer membrane receptor for ferrienterochelin and colicins